MSMNVLGSHVTIMVFVSTIEVVTNVNVPKDIKVLTAYKVSLTEG